MSLDALTEAVVEELNAGIWPTVDFNAVYDLLPTFKRETMGTEMFCRVVPSAAATAGRLNRNRSRFDLTVDIGFAKVLEADTIDVLRPLVQFVESVQTWFDENQTALVNCAYDRSEFSPLYVPQLLRDEAIFCSVLAVTYRKT